MNPFLIWQSGDELRLTAEFQHASSLKEIKLKSFCASRADREPEIREGLHLDLKHKTRHTSVDSGSAAFAVSLEMSALADGEQSKRLFHIECVMEVEFELKPGFTPSDAQLETFGRGNAVFLCWPYIREFVQNATMRLGIVVPPIPPLRTVPSEAADEPESEELAPPIETRSPKSKKTRPKRDVTAAVER